MLWSNCILQKLWSAFSQNHIFQTGVQDHTKSFQPIEKLFKNIIPKFYWSTPNISRDRWSFWRKIQQMNWTKINCPLLFTNWQSVFYVTLSYFSRRKGPLYSSLLLLTPGSYLREKNTLVFEHYTVGSVQKFKKIVCCKGNVKFDDIYDVLE